MNVLVTGANGQLGCSLRVLAAAFPAGGPELFFAQSLEKPIPAPPSTTPTHTTATPPLAGAAPSPSFADSDRRISFLFTDVVDASEESVAMLRKLGGEGVDISTTHLDITDLAAIRSLVREQCIDAIVNCAAYTNVEGAEDNQQLAELLNAKAPENLAIAMKEAGGLLVHVSTDYVFGTEPYNTPCREDQTGTPTGVYGLTKLHGEQAIRRIGCNHVIIRTAWLYSEFGKNFVRTMLQLTATRPQIKVVFDQTGTPTYAGDLAAAILTVLSAAATPRSDENNSSDKFVAKPIPAPTATMPTHTAADGTAHSPVAVIYHFSNEGVCSWYDFAKTIAEMADQVGHDAKRSACEILPCHSDEFPSKVKRPAYSVLDKTLIKTTFGLAIPYWTDSLRRCLNSLV